MVGQIKCNKSDSRSQLISQNDENSDNASDEYYYWKNKSMVTLTKPKLNVAKGASNTVIITSGCINSDIKDVLELKVWIGNHREKLRSFTDNSNDKVLTLFKKLNQLMGGFSIN